MNYKISENFARQLSADLDKKYLSSGVKLGGSIENNKIKLYTTDDHGKHSSFMTRTFYGKLNGDILNGKLSVSRYVLLLLGILAGFCIESIVMAVISASLISIFFPVVILVLEVLYFVFIKKISFENDKLINKYLEDLTIEN
ncbi:MAG: hypothetical protein IJT79_01710 [Ruminococcus sp.]|nr:hypothetical protein [Ruminococcus sp.]